MGVSFLSGVGDDEFVELISGVPEIDEKLIIPMGGASLKETKRVQALGIRRSGLGAGTSLPPIGDVHDPRLGL